MKTVEGSILMFSRKHREYLLGCRNNLLQSRIQSINHSINPVVPGTQTFVVETGVPTVAPPGCSPGEDMGR